jgi:hypothetical protein
MVETGLSGAGAAGRAESFEADLRRGVLETLSKNDPRRALESLDGGAFDTLFEDEGGKARIRDGLKLWSGKQELHEQQRQLAEIEAGRRRFADTLAVGFNDGSADAVHIELALASGAIDENHAEDLRGRLGDIEAYNGELDGIGRFILGGDEDPGFIIDGDKIGGFGPDSNDEGIFVDPEMIDGWWKREMERRKRFPGLTTLEDQQSPEFSLEIPAELLIHTVERTGHVPTSVTDGLRAAILAGDPAEKVAAGKQIAKLKKTAPEVAETLIGKLPPEEAQQITIIAGISELPLPPERIDGEPASTLGLKLLLEDSLFQVVFGIEQQRRSDAVGFVHLNLDNVPDFGEIGDRAHRPETGVQNLEIDQGFLRQDGAAPAPGTKCADWRQRQ